MTEFLDFGFSTSEEIALVLAQRLKSLRVQKEIAQADMAQRETRPEEIHRSLQQIARSSVRATHTVNQLLALARAEDSGRAMTLHPCNLAEITMDAVRDFLPRAMDKHIDLGYEGATADDRGVTLAGNRTLLKEAISNLLDNALNYTPSSAELPAVITAP